MQAGRPAGPLSRTGMQKMWKQLGSESRGFQNPEVTKGFSPGECRSRWEVVGPADSDGVL